MRTNSDVRPVSLLPLGDGTYHFNYNIEEVQVENEDQTFRPSFNCDTVHVSSCDYGIIASTMIAEKYTFEEEIAINRQRDVKPEKFQEYFDYCEECKSIVREALSHE